MVATSINNLVTKIYQSFSISYIEIGVNLNFSQFFGH